MKNYQNIPTEDWLKYPETKPKESGYYLTTYLNVNLYYKCIYWDNENQEWIWKQPFEVGCFVEKTGSKHYTDCLGKLQKLYGDIDFQQLIIDEILEEYENAYEEHLTSIIMQPEVYRVVEYYKNQNAIQKFFWEIKWGFIDCSINFKNWKGHMRGEEWDFWEILNGEWCDYE